MLNLTDLARVLPTLPPRRLQHHAYRVVANKHLAANPTLRPDQYLYSLGAPLAGARFTPRGGPATIYLAEEQQTAFDEANPEQAILRRTDPGLVRPTPPGRHVAVLYRLETVLDVTDAAVQQALGTGRTELIAPWRLIQLRGGVVPTQQLGQAVYDCGLFQALWYESARVPGTFCLAVFPDRLAAPAFLEVYDPDGIVQERLP